MIALIFLILASLLASIIYLTYTIYHLSFFKTNRVSRIAMIIFLMILAIFAYLDLINTVVVFLELTLTLLIFRHLAFIFKKVAKKELSYTLVFCIALAFTTIYMGYGYYLAHHVYETKYEIKVEKNIGTTNFRIAQITDSHIGATMNGDKFISYMEEISSKNPDIVVVTGDFIDDDTSKEDMVKACSGLGKLKTKYGVYFVYGNHDRGYYDNRGYETSDLEAELAKNGVIILKDETIDITDYITLIGREDNRVKTRKSMDSLLEHVDKAKYLIVLVHEPNDYDNEAKAQVDLVLSGHTHGGQIFPLGYVGLIIGANDGFYGLEKRDNTNFIISSGIGDWAIKFKTGAISEYVIIDLILEK